MTVSDPTIVLKGSNLHIGQHIVALHGRKKTRMLLEAMMGDNPGEPEKKPRPKGIDREYLRREVYAARADMDVSLRLRESQDGSLSKLISRSRKFLLESLAETPWSRELDWLVYSDEDRSWQLVRRKRA
ncbi:MAG: hypothetical protein H7249_20295 [Chitinophagaceae bacterium]|nr:hypothetical protein [Oligoflexus sp.]